MEFYLNVLVLMALYVIVATSFNLVLGYAGLFSVGHGVFYGLGAFGAALLGGWLGLPVWLSIIVGVLVTVILSLAIAVPSLRVSGDYLAIASLGFQVIFVGVVLNVPALGGTVGVMNIKPVIPGSGVQSSVEFLVLAVIVAVACVAASRWITRLPFGRVLRAMREDESATKLLGKDVAAFKIKVFMLSAGMAALAGGLYAHYAQYIDASGFDIPLSIQLISMVLVGGMATTLGPALGAILLVGVPDLLLFVPLPPGSGAPLQVMIYSAIVLAVLYALPNGILGGGESGRGARRLRGGRGLGENVGGSGSH